MVAKNEHNLVSIEVQILAWLKQYIIKTTIYINDKTMYNFLGKPRNWGNLRPNNLLICNKPNTEDPN